MIPFNEMGRVRDQAPTYRGLSDSSLQIVAMGVRQGLA